MADFALNHEEFEEQRALKARVSKNLLWVGMGSIVMLFAGFTSAYVVAHSREDWLEFALPQQFVITSTLFIVLSSITLIFAQAMIRQGKINLTIAGLFATLALGIGFTVSQFSGYSQLVEMNIHFVNSQVAGNVSGSFLYIITFLHLLHLAGGLFALIFTSVKAMLKGYSSDNYSGISVCAMYWHFLGILWIYLVGFFAFMHNWVIV